MFSNYGDVFLTTLEKDYANIFNFNPNNYSDTLLGIIGSIDPIFGIISHFNFKNIILVDINPAVIDYLDFRIKLLQDSKNGNDYLKKLVSILSNNKKSEHYLELLYSDNDKKERLKRIFQ